MLQGFGVKNEYIDAELRLLGQFHFARASDRSKLGSLRDQAYQASYHVARDNLRQLDLNLRIAETPCGPMAYASPGRVAPELLERTWRWSTAN